MKLTVNLGKNSYPIYIENNILDKAGSYISSCFSGKKIMIISDDNVFPLYGEKLKTSLGDYEVHELVLPHGEPTKAFETLPALYNALLKQKFSRSDLVIALGGGVIGDLAGFAASSYLRGIRFVQIPEILEMAMEHHHTIENPDVVQILQAEAETYEQIRQEMKL